MAQSSHDGSFKHKWAWFLASPWVIGLIVFTLYPLGRAFLFSFYDYSSLSDPTFIGLRNYRDLFVDPVFWTSLWNTLYYAIFSVFFQCCTAMFLAFLLARPIKGLLWYRTFFFLPTLMPVVASSVLWLWIYNSKSGLLNSFLQRVGIEGPAWLQDPLWAKPALILMAVWGAGQAMIIFLAGLQDIPESIHEAAVLDGSSTWSRMWFITLPMLSPVIYFNALIGIIGGMQVFTQSFIMTGDQGDPDRSTLFYVLHMYNTTFRDLDMGRASAMAVLLLLMIVGLSHLAHRLMTKMLYLQK